MHIIGDNSHVDSIQRRFGTFSDSEGSDSKALLFESVENECQQQTYATIATTTTVTYASLYQGFLAADRHRIIPPGASTLWNSPISWSTTPESGGNQSR